MGRCVQSKSAIGLKKKWSRPWSRQEIALLKKLYPDHKGPRDIANELGRTVRLGNSKQARKLGLYQKNANLWSKRELDLLKKAVSIALAALFQSSPQNFLFPLRDRPAFHKRPK